MRTAQLNFARFDAKQEQRIAELRSGHREEIARMGSDIRGEMARMGILNRPGTAQS
jgi:hypothetical protein